MHRKAPRIGDMGDIGQGSKIKANDQAQIKADVLNENKLLNDKLEQIEKKYEEKYRFLEGNINELILYLESHKKNMNNLNTNYENFRYFQRYL